MKEKGANFGGSKSGGMTYTSTLFYTLIYTKLGLFETEYIVKDKH